MPGHNFFVQCFDKDGKEIGDLRQSSYEYDLVRGIEGLIQRDRLDTSRVAAVFISTIEGFEPVPNA